MKRKAGDMTTQTLLDFDLGESSSDSDFRLEDCNDDDSGSDFSDKSRGNGGKASSSDDSEEEEDSDDSDLEFFKTTKGKSPDKIINVADLLDAKKPEYDKATLKLLSTPICCACLGDRSDDTNEIVECDGCGVTVHEGCYGVSESASVSSTVSSCSTEPWFCEACKADVVEPDCELCPNKGGIFKETDVGKWVHLVCALYVPGVAFGEVDQLSSVTLFEMPYNKWGAKACSLCDDARFARTGVVIGCDAGMCKNYFHVTCAQAAGFLSETHSDEADHADPFYAHCKIHSDKTMVKHRKRNYHGIRLKAENRRVDQQLKKNQKPTNEELRIERKLKKHRKKYIVNKEIKTEPWVPTQKMPRLLSTSATAMKKLLKKADLMGIDTAALEFQEAQMKALADVRKKWHIAPAFSVEFIGYFLDRTVRLRDLKTNLQEQIEQNGKLVEQQEKLRGQYDETMKKKQEVQNIYENLKESIEKLHNDILALCPTKQLLPVESIGKPIVSPSVVVNTPSNTPPTRTMSVPTAAALKMGVGFPLNNLIGPGGDKGKVLSTQCKQNGEELLNECGICKRVNDQHLLAKCDTCHFYYHLGCLNPPLTRHPKKSKLYGWQCSECDKSDDSDPERKILPKAPRKSRSRYSKDGVLIMDPPETPKIEDSPNKSNTSSIDTSKELVLELTKIDSSSFEFRGDEVEAPAPLQQTGKRKKGKPLVAAKKLKKDSPVPEEPAPKEPTPPPIEVPLEIPPPEPEVKIVEAQKSESPKIDKKQKIKDKKERKKLKHQGEATLIEASEPSLLAQSTHLTAELICSATEVVPPIEQSSGHRHKKRKEKHHRRSPSDKSPSKEHKRKRKHKNHDIENPADTSFTSSEVIIDRPRIKIKIKGLTDGSTSTTEIFYVANDPSEPTIVTTVEPIIPAVVKSPTVGKPRAIASSTPISSPNPVAKPSLIEIQETPIEVIPPASPTKAKNRSRASTSTTAASPKKSTGKAPVAEVKCDVCLNTGTPQNTVKCDECLKNYHFECLEPPLKKTPKRRGYSWHCADCDPTDRENN